MQRGRFQKRWRRALNEMPTPGSDRVDQIDILIERRPTARHRREAGLRPGETLLGLYEGVPQTERDSG